MTSKFRSLTCLLIADKYEIIHTNYLGILTINVNAKFAIPVPNDLLLIVAKPNAQNGSHVAALRSKNSHRNGSCLLFEDLLPQPILTSLH